MNYSEEDKEHNRQIRRILEVMYMSMMSTVQIKVEHRKLIQKVWATESNTTHELANEMEMVEFDHQNRFPEMQEERHMHICNKPLYGN